MGLAVFLDSAQGSCRACPQRPLLPPLLAHPVRGHTMAHGARDAALRAVRCVFAGPCDAARGPRLSRPRTRPACAFSCRGGTQRAGAVGCNYASSSTDSPRSQTAHRSRRFAGEDVAAWRHAIPNAPFAEPRTHACAWDALLVRRHSVLVGRGDFRHASTFRVPARQKEGKPRLPARFRPLERLAGVLLRSGGVRGEARGTGEKR
mmetsp:Transcript_49657/g.138994  ORF Transcript_49657/g.138994 Transcript_49657/m.138994 type:complete len:205 (-) Transcript_49657:1454-2068(-)